MTPRPPWLPAMVSIGGVREETIERLYQIFESDFKQGRPRLKGKPVWWDKRILSGETYEEGFWHLITREYNRSRERGFDPRRAEKISWCLPIINHHDDPCVKSWNYRGGRGRVETYLWLESQDYVAIFMRKNLRIGRVYIMLTAYHVDGNSSRRSLQRKYNNQCS